MSSASRKVPSPGTRLILTGPTGVAGFGDISPSLLDQLKDHKSCIWAMGLARSQFASNPDASKITYDYTVTYAKAFASLGSGSDPFRFIYVSVDLVNQSTTEGSYEVLNVKGKTEKALRQLEMENEGFQAVFIRPGIIDPISELSCTEPDFVG